MAVPAKVSGPGLPGSIHLLPSLVVIAALRGTLSAHALRQPPCCRLAPRPGGSASAGWAANEQVSLVAKCVLMPVPLQKASFVAVTLSPLPPPLDNPASFLQKQLCLKAPGEAAGSFRYWVLVQDPCPGSWLGEELPPSTNNSRGCFSWGARVSSQDHFVLSLTLRRCSWSHSPAVKWAQGEDLMKVKASS